MPKNIVILCDGTSNEVSEDRTNILRLYGTLKKDSEQIVFYDPGVGTFGAASSMSYYYRRGVEIWGLATGWGLDTNVKEAYRFIAEHYDDGKRPGSKKDVKPDKIYIFGFSRGAYTARVLAGFLHTYGLVAKENMNLLDYGYKAYKNIGLGHENSADRHSAFSEVKLFQRMLKPTYPTITMLGLFDTVGSVIESGRNGIRLRSHAFTRTNRSVASVRHAVAIDELRTMFTPQLFPADAEHWPEHFEQTSAVPQDVKEVWFSGVHGDVGGGYPERASALAKIPLHWMIEEAKPLGLRFIDQAVNSIVLGGKESKYVEPNSLAEPNSSMTKGWKVLEWLPRKHNAFDAHGQKGWFLPRSRRRSIPNGAHIHSSVFDRRNTSVDYAQPNIPDDHVVV